MSPTRPAPIGDLIQVSSLNEKNRLEIEKLGFGESAFPFEPESLVGNHLMKTVPMNVYMEEKNIRALSTAIRWDEQTARTREEFFSPRTEPRHTRVQPILHFTERDIWDTIHTHNLPFCSLYCQGYRSLGARSSTTRISDQPAWEQDLENTPERGRQRTGKRGHHGPAALAGIHVGSHRDSDGPTRRQRIGVNFWHRCRTTCRLPFPNPRDFTGDESDGIKRSHKNEKQKKGRGDGT